MSTNKFAAAAAAAAAVVNMTQASAGGGDYTPAPEGPCRLRLVGYVELGQHMGSYQGKPKKENLVQVTFELSGPKHAPVEIDGKKYPYLVTMKLNKSLSDKAKFFKLFQLLNWEGKATHMAELLGAAYKGRVVHRKYKGNDQKERTAVELFDGKTKSFTIEPPRKLDDDTGEYLPLQVDAPVSELKCFIWDFADMEQWSSIFIEGEYPEEKDSEGKVTRPARSKNLLQARIKQALNFKDSPVHALLLNNGQPIDIPDAGEEDDNDPPFDPDTPEGGTEDSNGGTMPDPLAG